MTEQPPQVSLQAIMQAIMQSKQELKEDIRDKTDNVKEELTGHIRDNSRKLQELERRMAGNKAETEAKLKVIVELERRMARQRPDATHAAYLAGSTLPTQVPNGDRVVNVDASALSNADVPQPAKKKKKKRSSGLYEQQLAVLLPSSM